MSITRDSLSPQDLLAFFQSLASDDAGDSDCQLHYGCSCIIRHGIAAAEKLIAIQELIGGPNLEGSAPASSSTPQEAVASAAAQAELEQRILAAEGAQRDLASRLDRAVKQNLKLADENIRLEQRARKLQDQINRLMDMREMSSILGRLEKRSAANAPASPPAQPEPEESTAAPQPIAETVQQPKPQPVKLSNAPDSAPAEDIFEFESAVPFREAPKPD